MQQRDLIATLGAPAPEQRSPWYAVRPTTLSLDGLAAHLVGAISGCRVNRSAPSEHTLVAGIAGGRDVWVVLRIGEARIEALPVPRTEEDEEHGGVVSSPDADDLEELAGQVAQAIQRATGWYLRSEQLFGFEPSGACTRCGTELFAWQDDCARCGAHVDASEMMGSLRVAETAVGMLVEDGLLVLGPGGEHLAQRLASALDKGLDREPARLFDIVSRHPDVSAQGLDVALFSQRVESARDVVRCPPPKERTRLATLREPTASEASPWHRARGPKPLPELAAALQSNGARCLQEDGARAVLVAGPVFVVLEASAATLDVRAVDSHRYNARRGNWVMNDEDTAALAERAAWIAERLQLATGWYVTSEWLSDCDPERSCAKCGQELFAWQERCPCEPPIHIELGRRLCDLLLAEALLELETPAARARVASALGALCEESEPARILDALVALDGVAEVFADEDDLDRLLLRAEDELS